MASPYVSNPPNVALYDDDFLGAIEDQPEREQSPEKGYKKQTTMHSINTHERERDGDYTLPGLVQPMDPTRKPFIRKVLLIVMAQLLVVIGVSGLFWFEPNTQDFVYSYGFELILASFVVEIVVLILLLCLRKKKAYAVPLMVVFTLSSSVIVATVVTFYDVVVVGEAFVATFLVVGVIVLYSLVTKREFTFLPYFILSTVFAIIFWQMLFWIAFFVYEVPWWHQILCVLGVILFSGYLLYDMRLLLNGYSDDEYVLASINLYLDIVNIFLCMLAIFGGGGGRR